MDRTDVPEADHNDVRPESDKASPLASVFYALFGVGCVAGAVWVTVLGYGDPSAPLLNRLIIAGVMLLVGVGLLLTAAGIITDPKSTNNNWWNPT